MTLLMPFRATILAFMIGSVMESKSATVQQYTLTNNDLKYKKNNAVILKMNKNTKVAMTIYQC